MTTPYFFTDAPSRIQSVSTFISKTDLSNTYLGASKKTLTNLLTSNTNVSSAAIHPIAPWIATGSKSAFIDIFLTNGKSIQAIKFHPSFLAERIGPVRVLEFHEVKPILVMGSDNDITIFIANKYSWDYSKSFN